MALYRDVATVGSLTMVSRVLGFLRDVLIAAVLGAGTVADAFFVAFRFPNLFRRLFAEGAFDSAFVPLFATRLQGEGLEAARGFAAQVFSLLTVTLIAVTVVAEIAMPWLIYGLAPGFAEDKEKFDLAVLLTRLAMPYLFCVSLVALYTGMLYSHGRFAMAALAPSLLNVVLIGVLIGVLVQGEGDAKAAGIALALGVTAGGVLQLIAVTGAAWQVGMRLNLRRPRLSPEIKRLFTLLLPGVVAGGAAQLNAVVGTIVASLQDRVVSWLYYAERIYQLPLGVVGVAIGVVLLPQLSRALRAGEREAVIASENRALELALLLALPAAVALFVASGPIVRVLFERGAFTAIDSAATAQALSAFAIGVPAFVLAKVFQPGFFAREDTKTPMLFALVSLFAKLLLSLLLFILLGAVGIALAASAAAWLNMTLLARELRRRGQFELDALFRRRFPRLVGSTLLMGASVWGMMLWLWPAFVPASGMLTQLASLATLVASGVAVYAASVQTLGGFDFLAMLRRARS